MINNCQLQVMFITRFRVFIVGLCWLGLSLQSVAANTSKLVAPQYNLQKCCVPCAAVYERSAYNTSYLQLFTLLELGREDWLFRSDQELSREFGPDPEHIQELSVFVEKLRQHGTQLMIVYVPTKGLVHPSKLPDNHWYDFQVASQAYRETLQRLRTSGALVPDLTALMDDQSEQEFYFRRDHHWTPYGSQRTAKLVADAIKDLPEYQQFNKTKFSTKRIGIMRKNGSLQIAWQRLCGNGFANQYVDEFTTEMATEGNLLDEEDVNSLFDDDSLPDITLVGTSFSKGAANYNFDGYLKEYLSVDILNEAMAGGSYDGSIMQYLISDAFQQQPPALLVWELPAYHSINSTLFYRQLNAQVDNGCEGKSVVLKQQSQLTLGRNEILFNGDGDVKQLASADYIVDMQFDDPSVSEVDFTVWYLNGRKDRTNIEVSPRVEMNGRFITRLRSDGEWRDFNFLSIDLSLKDSVPTGSVITKLCQYQNIDTEL